MTKMTAMLTWTALLLLPLGCGPDADDDHKDSADPGDTQGAQDTCDTDDTQVPAETGETGTPTADTQDSGAPAGPTVADLDPWVQPAVWVTPQDLEPGGSATVHYQGEYAEADALVIHYGFNGWNQVEGLSDFDTEESYGDTFYFKELAMNSSQDGGFQVDLDLPDDGRAIHFVFHEEESDGWDNNDDLDYHQSIRFPYIGPFLGWNTAARPEGGVVVSWETSVPCLGVVEYGPSEELGTMVAGEVFGTVHNVVLSDLSPGSTWYYRVNDSAGHASEIFSFHTAEEDTAAFSFVALSDMQDTGESQRWDDVAAELLASHSDAAFWLLPGDMPANDGPGQWWTFFDRGRELFARAALMAVPGNHDTPGIGSSTDTSSFERYFAFSSDSGGETFYSFDYGLARFIMLNSEDPSGFAVPDGEQYIFASSALDDCGDDACQWVFTAWHVPPYNVGARHHAEQHSFRQLTGLFDNRVDWCFSGHEHLYQRIIPMQYNAVSAPSGAYGRGADDGVGYIVLPPAGNEPETTIIPVGDEYERYRDRLAYPVLEGDESEVESELGFVVVTLDGQSITLQTWGMGTLDEQKDPWLRDEVSYTRP